MEQHRLNLLLVDDDEDEFVMTRDLLAEIKGANYSLEWAATYPAALEAIGRNAHDVYLFDYRLGERSGLELLREALENGCRGPMILLTGQEDHEVDVEAMRAGAADYLVKGRIDASLLERSIRYALERKRAEEERKRLQAQVIQSEKLAVLGELVAGVAHEISNPLAAIRGTAELLEMSEDPQIQEDAKSIRRMTDRATRIVRSLLNFGRVHGGEHRVVTLSDLVQTTLEVCAYKLRKADIAVMLRLENDALVLVDDNQIEQILLNLLNNAEHALREQRDDKRIVITTAVENREGAAWTTVSVADNGCGISEETQRRIFDPFFTTKDIGEGTGLGLSICHGIAQAHGGVLTVTSAVGEGTTFTLTLPAAAPRKLPGGEEHYARAA